MIKSYEKILAIVGAGGHASVVADAALLTGEWSSVALFDDYVPPGSKCAVWEVTGTTEQFLINAGSYSECVVAIGNNALRLGMALRLQAQGLTLARVIHPSAMVSPHCQVGDGCVVLGGAVVNIGCSIGLAGIVNNAATVNHDCNVQPGVHIGPNAALGGDVNVGQTSWIGIGASVKHGINIGSGVVVGAGAAVVSDIACNKTVVGVPAR